MLLSAISGDDLGNVVNLRAFRKGTWGGEIIPYIGEVLHHDEFLTKLED